MDRASCKLMPKGEKCLDWSDTWILGELMTSFGDHLEILFALLPLATHDLYVSNSIALHVYALCLAWTRFVIWTWTWFVIRDELRSLVILLSIFFIFVARWGCANRYKFISYISCMLYASISTCRGNSIKIFKFHKYVLLVFIQIYKHISRGSSLYSSNLGEFIHIKFWNFQEKWVSSSKVQIPSAPYALCIKLT